MDERTYYMILGVPRTETPGGIRSAYRHLARRLHPDVAGEQATRAFQEITEAYDVLSDPRRRRAYNDELRRAESRKRAAVRAPTAPPRRVAMHDRFRRDFTGIGAPAPERLATLNIEILLTPEEGRRGCVLAIRVPVVRRCPDCGGWGRDWLFPCVSCAQEGTIEEEQVVRARIPPAARSGSIFEMPLQGLGIHDVCLRLHVFVELDATGLGPPGSPRRNRWP